MTKNINSTRYFSNIQEQSVCKALGAVQQPNSGAGLFRKGDCVQYESSLLCECKTSITDKDSFTIKKSWLSKNKEEMFNLRLNNSCIAFNFGPNQQNYYIIDEVLMQFLVDALVKEFK